MVIQGKKAILKKIVVHGMHQYLFLIYEFLAHFQEA